MVLTQPHNAPRNKPLILIVEDDEQSRQLMIDVMESCDYLTLTAKNGKQALEVFQTQPPDLVLMDARMPVMDGFEACAAIKRLPNGQDTPVLMLTGLNDDQSIEKAFEAGAADYLIKPIHWGMLTNRVRTIIKARQAEAAVSSLREMVDSALSSAPFLYRLVNNLPGMVYRSHYNPNWEMEYVSVGSLALTGYYPADLMNNRRVSYIDLIHPADRQQTWHVINDAIDNQKSFDVYYRIRCANGSEKLVWEQGRGVLAEGEQGRIVEGFVMDLTERKLMEDAVLRERTLMRTVIDNLKDYIFAKDTSGRFIVSNRANAHYLGVKKPSETIGKSNKDFYPPDIAQRYDADDRAVMDSDQETFYWEEEVKDQETGTKKWYAITKAKLHDQDHQVVGLVGMIRDITEAKKGEEEMRLANEQLVELSRLKSHFLLKMSHELRTPLNSIIGYTQMLLEGLNGPLNEKQLDRLERVAQNGQHLLELITDMLDLSKIQTDSMEMALERVNLKVVVNEAIAAFMALAQQRQLTLEATVSPDLPLVLADRSGILKVLMHLISNGLKFTQKGGVFVQANSLLPADTLPFAVDRSHPWVLLTVRDTGIGIEPEKIDSLFNEFHQIDNAPTREVGGTGLGLAISYKLIRMMNGHVWIESEAGKGSQFKVLLPVG